MNEHINRSAAEADLDRALANDPFLFGLDTTAPEPSPVSPVIDEQQRLAGARRRAGVPGWQAQAACPGT